MLEPLHVVVTFGSAISSSVQGKALLAFERHLRSLTDGMWIEVFKEAKGDDSKLRNMMTPEQRSRL